MITPHTQESLKSLSWDEVRSLHTSLGLAATATSRTRRDYESRILEVQPQKIEEPIAPTATPTQPIAQTTSETQKLQSDLDLLIERELKAQLAIERTVEGSPEEVTAYSHLRTIEASILEVEGAIARSYPRIWEKADPSMAIGDYIRIPFHPVSVVADKEEMSDGRTRILVRTGNHSEEWHLPAPLISPVNSINPRKLKVVPNSVEIFPVASIEDVPGDLMASIYHGYEVAITSQISFREAKWTEEQILDYKGEIEDCDLDDLSADDDIHIVFAEHLPECPSEIPNLVVFRIKHIELGRSPCLGIRLAAEAIASLKNN